MFRPRRVETAEFLDEQDAPLPDVDRSLRDLRWINAYCGGVVIYRRLVRRFAPSSIVDVGTGTSDLLESVPHVALRVGVDFKIAHLNFVADRRGIHRVVADARRMPFRTGSVDLVTSAHFFHHFPPEENQKILSESLRIARRGVAVNDTRRNWFPLAFVQLLALLRLVGRITRYDAPASVRQGYTVREARRIAATAGAARHEIVRLWPFRLGILLWKD